MTFCSDINDAIIDYRRDPVPGNIVADYNVCFVESLFEGWPYVLVVAMDNIKKG